MTNSMWGRCFGKAALHGEAGEEDLTHLLPRSLYKGWKVLNSISVMWTINNILSKQHLLLASRPLQSVFCLLYFGITNVLPHFLVTLILGTNILSKIIKGEFKDSAKGAAYAGVLKLLWSHSWLQLWLHALCVLYMGCKQLSYQYAEIVSLCMIAYFALLSPVKIFVMS